MEYAYCAALTWLLLFVSGLAICLGCLPSPLRLYAVVFAPSVGYCYLVFVSYYLYRADVGGTDKYSTALLILPVGLLLIIGMRAIGRSGRITDFVNRDVVLLGSITLFGFGVMSIPFLLLAKHGAPTSLTIGNLDIAELAVVSRFLQEFPRSSKIGILAQTGHFVWTGDDAWFGPSAIVAVVSSLLRSEPYKLQSLVMNVLASQGIGFVYLLARIGLAYSRVSAAGITFIYALSPIVMYTVWHSFGGQMITMSLSLAILVVHIVAAQHVEHASAYRAYAPAMVILFSGVLLTYHFMILVVTLLLLGYTLSHGLFTGRLATSARLSAFVLALAGASFLLNPLRVAGLVGTWAMFASSNNGWFIAWLSPDLLLGANAGRALLGGGVRPGARAVWATMTAVALVATVVYSLRMPRQAGHLSFLVGLVLPIWLIGFYFALAGMDHGQLGGYRSFKITSTFAAITLLGLSLPMQTLSWRTGKTKALVAGVCFVAIVTASASSVGRFVALAQRSAYVLPDEVVGLKHIESLPSVKSIYILDTDDFSLLWTNYFTFRKSQVYQRFPYGGRPVGPPVESHFLTKTEEARTLGFSHDMMFVDPSEMPDKYEINGWFTLYRPAPERDVRVVPGDGWLEAGPKTLWCGTESGSCSIWLDSRSDGVKVSIGARFMPLRTGEQMTVTLNGQPIPTLGTTTELVTHPVALKVGRNVLRFSSSPSSTLRETGVNRDPYSGLIGWRSIIVRFPDAALLARGPNR